MTIENITTMTPSEVDNILVNAMFVVGRNEQLIEAFTTSNDAKRKNLEKNLSNIEGIELSDYEKSYWAKRTVQVRAEIAKGEAAIAEATPVLEAARITEAECNEEYNRRGGWTRFWIVSNSNGHIHTSLYCSTCFPTTQYAWLPNLSGSTNAEVVELAGMSACTICFPDAPVDTRNRPSKIEEPAKQAAREERERKAAEKAAKVAEKGITNPDGSVVKLSGRYGDKIKTLTEAQRVFVNNLVSILLDDNGRHVIANREYLEEMKTDNEILKTAIVHKNAGKKTEDEVVAELTKKAETKIKREWK